MPTKNGNSMDSIAKHTQILNEEVGLIKIDVGKLKIGFGKVKNDINWLKRVAGYQATLITGLTIAVLGAVIKYIFLS